MLARDTKPSTPISARMASMLGKNASSPLSQPVSSPLAGVKSGKDLQNEWNFLRHLGTLEDSQNVMHVLERSDSDNYAVFGEEAEIAANALFNSTNSVTFPFGSEYSGMLTLNHANQLSSLLQEFLLLREGWRVELWSWDGVRKAFRCLKRASPGNLESVEDLLNISLDDLKDLSSTPSQPSSLLSSVSPVIAALHMNIDMATGGCEVALSWCDLSSLRLGYLSFPDNNLLTSLEAALIQLGVRELLCPKEAFSGPNNAFNEKVSQIAGASELVLQFLKPSEYFGCENVSGVEEDLARLIGQERFQLSELSVNLTRTLRCLFSYLNLLGVDSNYGAFKLIQHNLKDFARVDEAALTSLNVFPKSSAGRAATSSSFSVFGFLDHCKTVGGSRTLNQWLRQPLTNLQLIETRLDLVELFVQCPEVRHRLREFVFRGIPDISKLLKRLIRARSSLQELVQLYQAVAKLHQVLLEMEAGESLGNHLSFGALESAFLTPMRQLTEQLSPFVQMIEDTIDFEALERNEYCLRPDFDPELKEVSAEKGRTLDAMEPEFRRVCSALRLEAGKKCKLERNSVYGYFFRISRLDAAKLPQLGAKRGRSLADFSDDEEEEKQAEQDDGRAYTELATLKSGVFFTTPKLTQLARRYDALNEDYADKQSTLVTSLLTAAQPFRSSFDVLGTLLGMLDVVLALAHVAGTSSGSFVRATFSATDDAVLDLRAARHPCVEIQPGCNFIPNDVVFRRSQGQVLQFITGPNMGGKSTFIRQTALIAILAQCGSFVPCDSATLPVFDAILVRVGAGDNINRGISTFMAEMLETATILKTATSKSLVVIDELGRGTSTCDGISLSRAISQYLAVKIECFTLFATHFHELTRLSEEFPGKITNLHVAVNESTDGLGVMMLFKVRPGVCAQSYGIHVAKAVNFPESVIRMAEWRADILEGRRGAELTSEEVEFLSGADASNPPETLLKYL